MIRKAALTALLPALLVAGCGGDPADNGKGEGKAGELVGGTISDDMLPLPEVTSQSPAMKVEPAASSSSDKDSAPSDQASDDPAAKAETAPAADSGNDGNQE